MDQTEYNYSENCFIQTYWIIDIILNRATLEVLNYWNPKIGNKKKH